MPRPSTTSLAALCAIAALTAPAFVTGQSAGQILRPDQENAPAILQADRVARLVLQLPVEPEAAFDAWTNATQLVEWFSHWAEMTVAPGESYSVGWEGFAGEWQGSYLEVERPERLSFTWLPPAEVFPAGAYETTVTLTFEEDDDGGTVMTLEHTGFRGAPELEAQLEAWRGYLYALRAFLLQPSTP